MSKIVISTILIILASSSHAAGSLGYQQINAVSFNTTGFFLHADSWPNPNSCTRTGSVVLLDSDPNYEKAYALLLAAYMSGKQVSGYSNGCTTHDGQTYNTIRGYKYLVVK